MLSGNIILAVIVTLVVSTVNANVLRRKITTDSYTYDPDSIIQNEKILRLFLRFASDTANRLIRLKNEAKLRPKPHVDRDEPVWRIDLSDDDRERRIVDRERRPTDATDSDASRRSKESTDPGDPARPDSSASQSDRDRNSASKSENDRREIPRILRTDNDTDSNNVGDKSNDAKGPMALRTPEGNSESKTTKNINSADSTEHPVDIENRLMMNVEKTNYVSHSEHSQTITSADTSITDLQPPLEKKVQLPQTVPTNLDFSTPNQDVFSTNLNLGSPSPQVMIQNAESATSNQNTEASNTASKNQSASATIVDSTRALSSNIPDKTAAMDNQISGSPSNFQSDLVRKIKVQESVSGNGGNKAAEINPKSSADLNIHRNLKELNQSTQSIPLLSGTEGTIATATNGIVAINPANQVTSLLVGNQKNDGPVDASKSILLTNVDPASVLSNRRSSSLMNPHQGSLPIPNIENETSNSLTQLTNVVPLILKEIKTSAEPITQIATGKSGGPLTGFTDSGSGNDGSSLLEKASGTLSNVGTSVVRENSVPSIAVSSVGGILESGSSVGGILESGSRLLGSVPLFRSFPDLEESPVTDTGVFRDSANTTENNANQIQFKPSVNPNNANLENPSNGKNHSLINPENSINESVNKLPLNTNGGNNSEESADVALSELELQDFTNKFKDALQPIDSLE